MLSIINFLTTIKIIAPSTVPSLTYHYTHFEPKTNGSKTRPDKSYFKMKLDCTIYTKVEETFPLGEIKLVMWYVGPTNPAEAIGSIPLCNVFPKVLVDGNNRDIKIFILELKDKKTNSKLLSKLEAASQKDQNTCVFFQIYGLLEKTDQACVSKTINSDKGYRLTNKNIEEVNINTYNLPALVTTLPKEIIEADKESKKDEGKDSGTEHQVHVRVRPARPRRPRDHNQHPHILLRWARPVNHT